MGWSSQAVVAQLVIIEGPNDGLFVYSGTPAAGTLVASITNGPGTDQFGNAYQEGITSYVAGSATRYTQTDGAIIHFSGTVTHLVATISGGNGLLNLASGQRNVGDVALAVAMNSKANSLGNVAPGMVVAAGAAVAATDAMLEVQGSVGLAEVADPASISGSGYLFVDTGGHLVYIGPSGTRTVIANP